MAERLEFDVFARDNASASFTRVGKAASAASDDVMGLARHLDEISKKSVEARVGLKGDTEALAKLDKLDLKMVSIGHRVMDPNISIEGAAKAAVELAALNAEVDRLGKTSVKAGGASGVGALAGTGGIPGGGIGALIGLGVALSPVIATVSVGLAGFGAAAFAAGAPILKAAQATGGLAANLKTLDPEQKKVALGILGLGQQFDKFEKALQPQVLRVFNQGIKLAGNLMTSVEPVAKATGIALGSMLHQVDREFRSQTWQQFFGFMAKTAGPDIKLLSDTFVALLDTLPPLLEALQPVATALLTLTKDAAQALDVFSHFPHIVTASTLGLTDFAAKSKATKGSLDLFSQSTSNAVQHASTGNPVIGAFGRALGFLGSASAGAKVWLGLATGNIKASGDASYHAAPKVWSLNSAVTALNTSMTTLVGNLLTLQGSELAWRQALRAAEVQVRSNSAGLAGNSKNALANKAAVLASTNAAIAFASQELTTGKDIGGASRTVQAQIRFLQGLHDKSAFVRAEIKALRLEEQKLQEQKINQMISVHAFAKWNIVHGGGPQGMGVGRAAGWRVPGYGGGDRWPALLEGGEAVVPKHLTPAVAPFLKAHKVPGFAAGGLIPTHTGLPGMVPWVKTDDAATIRLIDQAVARAALAGLRAAQSSAAFGGGSGGPASGAVRALQQYAASLFPHYGWSAAQLPALIALWNGESGWNPNARNPSSGAFGIPQALPPGKMGALAASGNAAAQIRWGEGYIASVYGSPIGAYNLWQSRSPHWYDHGGYLPPGVSVAVNQTGRPEPVLPPGRSGGPVLNIENYNSYTGTDEQLLGQKLSFAVQAAGFSS